jgi:hypothetical protein
MIKIVFGKKSLIFVIIVCFIVSLSLLSVKIFNNYPNNINLKHRGGEFGITFSKKFCEELGLNWKDVYQATLDDLKVKYIRLPAYWDEIEKTEGNYSFEELDYMVNEASLRNAQLIVTVGRRQPRWPECHIPAWTNKKSEAESQAHILQMIKEIVVRYKDNPNVIYWQVENEAFLGTFGECPSLDEKFLEKEVALVRSLDSRPVIITGSGELSSWRSEGKLGNIFGTTMYRVVYNRTLGFIRYPFPSVFYRLKARIAGIPDNRMMIMELQLEPWVPEGKMTYLDQRNIDKSMSINQFKANIQYAIDVDFKQIYTWGVEWWYWQKLYGNPEYWNIAKTIFN